MKELLKKLCSIQSEMKAPKNLYNSFGKYKYRNAEGILEAFKPFGKKYGLVLLLNDEVVETSAADYIKSTAILIDVETGDEIKNSALARESAEKKGMDDSQITGTASSYARKYALNGLLLLDDTKDADTDEYHEQTHQDKSGIITDDNAKLLITKEQLDKINSEIERTGMDVKKILSLFKIKDLKEMNNTQFTTCMNKFKATPTREDK